MLTFIFFLVQYIFMYEKNKLPILVVDSCFWINIVYLELEEYLLKYFNLFFVFKVTEEILNINGNKLYDSKDMDILKKLIDNKKVILKNPKEIPEKINNCIENDSGELYSVALALEKKGIVATDDGAVINYCIENNIFIMTSVRFSLFLYAKKEINKNKTIILLKKMNRRIKHKYIEEGINYLKNKR
jgi:predicted nucleic acid-binding protein